MKKLITTIFAIGLFLPVVAEAGAFRGKEPKRRKPKCRQDRGVVVCRMPKPRKPKRCGIMPCIPPGYYRPMPPRVIPMG